MAYAKDTSGFTLIEIIMVLLILSVMGTVVGLGIVQVSKNFVFAMDNQEVLGKSQLAMYRLIKEFALIESVSSGTTTSISYTRQTPGGGTASVTLSLSGSNLLLNGNILVDDVQSFSLGYYRKYNKAARSSFESTRTRMVGVTFSMLAADDISQEFATRVALKYL